jgi:hypothetical protein
MERKTRSLLEELEALSKNRDSRHIIENHANNIISSAIHLLDLIKRNYSEEQAVLLEKRLLSSIKNRDSSRFSKTIRKSSDATATNQEDSDKAD